MPKHVWTIATLLCEKLLEEKDGGLSIIRIADRLTVEKPDFGNLPDPPTPVASLCGIFAFRGDEPGDHIVQIRIHSPSKREAQVGPDIPIRIEGPHRGMNLPTKMLLEVREEGLYWIEVLVDGEICCRVPLEVVYQISQDAPAQKPPQ